MNIEQLTKRYQHRSGFRLADVAEVGLPVYQINVQAVTLAHKRLAPIEEFLLRSIAMELSTEEELSQYLGLNREVIRPALVNLAQTESIALTALQGRQSWALTTKGRATLETTELIAPEEKTFPIHFDAILRRPTLFRFHRLLRAKDLKEQGLIEIEVYPPRRPQLDEISPAHLERILRTTSVSSEQRRDVLAVRNLDSRSIKKSYLRALAFFFKSIDGKETQLSFVIDGKESQEHEVAFAKNEGFRRTLENIKRDVPETNEIVALTGNLAAPESPKQVEIETARRAVEAIVAETQEALKLAPDPGKAEIQKKLEVAEAELSKLRSEAHQFEVRNLYVMDHAPLLEDAISSAKIRILIISPWITAMVVTRDFTKKLENLLRQGVKIYIGYGIEEQDRKPPSSADLGAIKRLQDLANQFPAFSFRRFGNTHAKVLIKDAEFAAITSFNWLSFKGDPNRKFRDEQGLLIRRPDLVDQKFTELVGRFVVPVVAGSV